jgi:hypothetical protein
MIYFPYNRQNNIMSSKSTGKDNKFEHDFLNQFGDIWKIRW